MREQLRALDRAEPPEQWSEIAQRVPSPEMQPPSRRASRIATALLAFALAVAGIAFAVRALTPSEEGPQPGQSSGQTSSIRAYTDPTGLWTVNYPSTWTATPIARTSDGLATGVTIANAQAFVSPASPHAVSLTVTHAINQDSSFAADSSFPLSMKDFGAEPGPQDAADLSFQANGITYLARIVTRSDATEKDVADLQATIASIRFPSLEKAGQVANGWTSLGSAQQYPKGVGRSTPFGSGSIGYLMRGPASTYLLDLPLPTSYLRRCAESHDETWDPVHLQIWIRCPAGDVRYERDGTPVAGNPAGLTRPLVAYPVITAWDGTLLLSPTPMTRAQAQRAWGG